MNNILILGGTGQLGRSIYEAIVDKGNCSISSRSNVKNYIYFDWSKSETFKNLASFKIIINASPVTNFNLYFEFLKKALGANQVFIETTANSSLVKEILSLQESYSEKIKGTFIHGAGIFPGISNFMVKALLKTQPNAKTIKFNVKYSVFSKAGKDMCRLMAESLTTPSVYFENKVEKFDKPVGTFQSFNKNNTKWYGFLANLPDTRYFWAMHPNFSFVASYFTPMASWLLPFLKIMNYLPKNTFLTDFYSKSFYLMRGKFFKNKTSKMTLSAIIDNKQSVFFETKDALRMAGIAVSACMNHIPESKGIFRIDEITDADSYFKTLSTISAIEFELSYY